ncbi:acid sphingomyelinase-like phosphodiesterase 3b [Saccoglossus kowalevskii]|uniref:Acid sphingomyelinase-like phosphodiesterase 3b-like n=1 Tax=Saccoglossus kowalevskii TaxID=10224 RepID=A0ABM0GV42_SACKO|nr:PREDICTED: acid sphingomyelinase-like phosphodiesterase 3b-like [Saccoglossus kowalevskii]
MVLLFVGTSYGSNIGRIWHVTDIHYEPNYTAGDYPASSCRDLDGGTPGYWGDYRCDSPWALVNSSVYAMRSIEENPDFIIWTGDDTPHVPDDNLSTDKVIDIITNVTTLLSETFPGTTVFPVFGNHDYHPKHMFPPMTNPVYSTIADLWSHWLGDYPAFNEKFRKVAYYTAQFTAGLRIVGLNTVYYYTSNKVTEDLEDPGDQFVWLESVLNQAATDGEKVGTLRILDDMMTLVDDMMSLVDDMMSLVEDMMPLVVNMMSLVVNMMSLVADMMSLVDDMMSLVDDMMLLVDNMMSLVDDMMSLVIDMMSLVVNMMSLVDDMMSLVDDMMPLVDNMMSLVDDMMSLVIDMMSLVVNMMSFVDDMMPLVDNMMSLVDDMMSLGVDKMSLVDDMMSLVGI